MEPQSQGCHDYSYPQGLEFTIGGITATLLAEPLTCPLMQKIFGIWEDLCCQGCVDPQLHCFHGRQALMACRLSSVTGSVEKCAAKLV